ncbi:MULTISPECIES: fumarylacetoacetase [Protofrankia]|uniref:fumarylacetoacetase n=1 Tax=Candidatus Protofrankia datiscae TaxID=2716812 RepID=F8AWJ3_9ACTN|nr:MULTISPECIES: fumarylacetoacetase [Protofrankia]AEH09330.1 fumarylacetoacetase [Candidatus Protofrankia datiscae]
MTPDTRPPAGPLDAAASRASWVEVEHDHPFGIRTLPYGSFTTPDAPGARVGVAIGEHILDLTAAAGALLPEHAGLFTAGSLDRLLAAGPTVWSQVRSRVMRWLADERYRRAVEPLLVPAATATPRLPFTVADYVDFYASEHHATNLGRILRPDGDPLTPNWKHLPIGYHGRSGTMVVSGTPVVRPRGQLRAPGSEITFAPTARLDIEAEVGFVVGTPSRPGRPVPLAETERHVFGVCLVNDWSARDIQAWEYVPLGPFLGKSFATSVSAWIVPLDALRHARVPAPPRDPRPLPYLDDTGAPPGGFDIELEISLNRHLLSRPPFAGMYWTVAQQLAHLTVNGASLRTGDLLASGTVSGPTRAQCGSLIELTWNGTQPLTLPDGSTRDFLEDGDEVVITGTAPGPDATVIGLGEVRARILPSAP